MRLIPLAGCLFRAMLRNVGWLSFYLLVTDALGVEWWPGRPGFRIAVVLGAAFAFASLEILSRAAERAWQRRAGSVAG